MSATEELRALLDERGVEHRDVTPANVPWHNWVTKVFLDDGRWMQAIETNGGDFTINLYGLTPAQAVEATLGRGTCTMEPDGYYGEQYGVYRCSSCGELWQFGCDGPKEHGWACCPKCRATIDYGEEAS